MAAPILTDYQFQYKDSGIKLNNDFVAGQAIWDVDQVTGLDMPIPDINIDAVDGAHGSNVNVLYFAERTIVISGTVYAASNDVDVLIDSLNANYLPDDIEYPFYFKGNGVTRRYVNAKTLGAKCSLDNLRRLGSSKYQIQLVAPRPVKMSEAISTVLVNNTNLSVINSGNFSCWPIFTITGAYSSITLLNAAQNKSVVITATAIAGDITVVDMATRSVKINGINRTGAVSNRNWWSIGAGVTEQIRYTVTGGTPIVSAFTYNGWI